MILRDDFLHLALIPPEIHISGRETTTGKYIWSNISEEKVKASLFWSHILP